MKTIKLLSFLISMLFISCGQDELNNCPDYDCLNGGMCLHGGCACAEGFTEDNCSEKIARRIQLDEVIVSQFPALRLNGEEWDGPFNTDPDIYVSILLQEQVMFAFPEDIQEARYTEVYTFMVPESNEVVFETNLTYKVALFDRDSNGDDLMGELFLYPSDFPNEEGDMIPSITASTGAVTFELIFK